jgi:hypothetical protein
LFTFVGYVLNLSIKAEDSFPEYILGISPQNVSLVISWSDVNMMCFPFFLNYDKIHQGNPGGPLRRNGEQDEKKQ